MIVQRCSEAQREGHTLTRGDESGNASETMARQPTSIR